MPDVNQAMRVEVKAANELLLDLTVKPVHFYRIRGRVIDARTGKPPVTIDLTLSFKSVDGIGLTMAQQQKYDPDTGAFEILRALPGAYSLRVRTRGGALAAGQTTVNVVDADVENVDLVISTGVALPGRIQREGEQIPAFFGFRVSLAPAMAGELPASIEPQIAEDGLFTLPPVTPGEYRVKVSGMAFAFYVKSLKYAGVDVLGKTMKVSAGASGTLEILVQRSTSNVSGSVRDAQLRPVTGVEVILVPEDPGRTELYRIVRTQADGGFTFGPIAPGRYRAFSWEAFEPAAYFDPEFVRRYEAQGRAVVVSESGTSNIDLTMIPAEP
jgi:hypothetical protein